MEKRVNLLFIVFAASVTVVNIFLILIRGSGDVHHLWNISVYIPIFGSCIFLALHFGPLVVMRASHIFFLILISVLAIFDSFDSAYALGFSLLAMYLAQKYGYLTRHAVLKAVLSLVAFIFVIELAAYREHSSGTGADIILFVLFFFAIFYFGDKETLLRAKEREDLLKERIRRELGSGVDLKKMGFTEREIEVGAILCQTLGTDKEIAYDLNISINTVINHMRSMREKAGVRDRQHLIKAIQGYYFHRDIEEK